VNKLNWTLNKNFLFTEEKTWKKNYTSSLRIQIPREGGWPQGKGAGRWNRGMGAGG